jgi:hypothetical protein
MTPPTLVFVYAGDSGLLHGVIDTFHKILSPATYACNLCALTYTRTGKQRGDWVRAVRDLGMPSVFLHRDELRLRPGAMDVPLPAVLVDRGGAHTPLVSREEIEACGDLDALIALVSTRAQALS